MRKLFVILLICTMLIGTAYASDIILSDMSYDELLILQRELSKEIMSRSEWKEVTVPAGFWKVGEDIPSGIYCIKVEDESCYVCIWRKAIDDYSNDGLYYGEVVEVGNPCGKIELLDGMIVTLDNKAIFTPPITLGF